jgi:hypothetical protein
MNKIYFLIITAALLANTIHGQSKADLIRSIEELKVTAIQNQTKIELLQKDVENLKVRVISSESRIQSQEKEILRLNQLLSVNSPTDITEVVENNIIELSTDKIDLDDDTVANDVQIKANYPGGEAAFRDYVAGEFIYPQRCQDEGINGSVMLRFVVDEAGRISRVHAIEDTKSCPEFTSEAIRVLKKSPRWVPGQNNGNFLRSWREIPIRLNISK